MPARDVGDVTGFPPLFGGRVKTLHPKIFGGILYDRDDPEHRIQAQTYAVPAIATVVANLYPFEATVAREGTQLAEAIEQIDIGGVSLLSAAAKNFEHVAVLTHPSQYAQYLAALAAGDAAAVRCAANSRWLRSSVPPNTTWRFRTIWLPRAKFCRAIFRARWH